VKTSQAGLDLIKKYEGLRLEAYLCPAGVWTIGYGSTKDVKRGDKITTQQALQCLLDDVQGAESAVHRLVKVSITQGQFDALVSFVFNLGSANLASSTLLKKLNAGDYSGAAKEFRRWVFAGGKRLAGLVKRRADEEALFNGEQT
jgi:lysozyme